MDICMLITQNNWSAWFELRRHCAQEKKNSVVSKHVNMEVKKLLKVALLMNVKNIRMNMAHVVFTSGAT